MAVIREFDDGSTLEYARGRFDDHCLYLRRPNMKRHAPRDSQYFATLQALAKSHGATRVYGDFVTIYELTGKEYEYAMNDCIRDIAGSYGSDSLDAEILFTILYAAMVAEERKLHTKLGKRVKRLGIHQVVIEGYNVDVAANFSRGKPWQAIAKECEARGF